MSFFRPLTVIPPVTMLLTALVWSLLDFDGFLTRASEANQWILQHFDWAFLLFSFAAILLLIYVAISPLGGVRIGGRDATPILSRWNWFAITLCTTIAIGILFWAAAEPIMHVSNPPNFAAVVAGSDQASVFAISTLYMHWTVTPYALYSVCALAFALSFHNLRSAYSLSGPMRVVFGSSVDGTPAAIIDAVGLFALVAGVAASLGVGVITISGGLRDVFGFLDSVFLRGCVAVAVIVSFIASSVSGLQKGIKTLSDINVRIFVMIAVFVFVLGPTGDIVSLGAKGAIDYVVGFVPNSLPIGARVEDVWMRDWTVFYFANWLAWAPVTAMFLGRISIGYTVREFMLFNLLVPALFSALWMATFGGGAILLNDLQQGALGESISAQGPEIAIYELLRSLPFASLTVVFFVVVTFISFVTAMDSNTQSIADISLKDGSTQSRDKSMRYVKIFWGALIGAVAFTMTATTGIDGVRMLSNLGGLPGLIILIIFGTSLVVMRVRHLDELENASPR